MALIKTKNSSNSPNSRLVRFRLRFVGFFPSHHALKKTIVVFLLLCFFLWYLCVIFGGNLTQCFGLPCSNNSDFKQRHIQPVSNSFTHDDNDERAQLDERKMRLNIYSQGPSPSRKIEDLMAEASNSAHNLPRPPALSLYGTGMSRKSKCGRFPIFMEIHFSSIYWQVTRTSRGPHYLYNAYLDNRTGSLLGPTVKIKTAVDLAKPNITLFCQLWFINASEPVISEIFGYTYLSVRSFNSQKSGLLHPYYLSCPLPLTHRHQVPISVSVVEKPCDQATNNLRVIYDLPEPGKPREGFVVCPKALDFSYDNSIRIVEWVEMLRALGASKIILFVLFVHPNTTKVLEYYHQKGFVEHIPYSAPGYYPNDPRLRHIFLKNRKDAFLQNVFVYTDCIYRSMYRYKWLANFDVDEVIVPANSSNWDDLIKESIVGGFRPKSLSSYCFRNTIYGDNMTQSNFNFPGIPNYFHMLNHIYRGTESLPNGIVTKCFHDLDKVCTTHNHYPIICLNRRRCTSRMIPETIGHVQHYRGRCYGKNQATPYCGTGVRDTNIWRFKEQVIHRSNGVLKNLGYFN